VRLFFAVELPSQVQSVLGHLGRDTSGDYRWVDPNLMHLTLAFLGEQPESRLHELELIGLGCAASHRGGVLRLGEAGSFGTKRAPRVLWVDVTGDVVTLLELQRDLDTRLRRAGFPSEDREFRAHITLARRRETARGVAPEGWPPNVEHVRFELGQLTLMQSRLSPRGPTYTPLFQFPLGG
jgi:RNA 2',3'-cyclic 3'-phosphodiesterase